MSKENKVNIIEKPESISWDDIHECLWNSHAQNRANGVMMKFPSLPGEEIKKRIEAGNGKMFIATIDDNLVGVAGYQVKKCKSWYCTGNYLYLCFAGILPEYSGKGIYKKLYIYIEREREKLHLPIVLFDTHESNLHMIEINQHNGFVKVDYKRYGDHYNVVMAKWGDSCPYSKWYIKLRYLLKKYKLKLKYLIKM